MAVLIVAGAAAQAPQIMGTPPTADPGTISAVGNGNAIVARFWMPGLDDGYVPQGLTFADGRVLVSAYVSRSPSVPRGRSRVFAVDAATGATVGSFALPPDVGHPGGLAYGGNDVLYVADRSKLYRIDLPRALADGHSDGAVTGRAVVDEAMGPSYLAHDRGYLWFGRYQRAGEPRIYRVAVTRAFPPDGGDGYIDPDAAERSLPVAVRSQGATVDADGFLWVSQSSGEGGTVQKLDPATGVLLESYALMAGLEDLSFSPDRLLWSVSEAGSARWRAWETYYPLIFAVDVRRLR